MKISLKFIPKGPINNIPALVQTRQQAIIWTNDDYFTDAYMHLSLNELRFVGHSYYSTYSLCAYGTLLKQIWMASGCSFAIRTGCDSLKTNGGTPAYLLPRD